MIVLFDTNVVLDVLLARSPHHVAASQLFAAVETARLSGLLGATTVTTIYYLAARATDDRRARQEVRQLLKLFNLAPVTRTVIDDALALRGFADFEDAVLHETARHAGAAAIVTRNTKDFTRATLKVYSPLDLLRAL